MLIGKRIDCEMFANFEKREFESEKIGLHGVCSYFDVRGPHIVNVSGLLPSYDKLILSAA